MNFSDSSLDTVYDEVGPYLRCGDVFYELAIPLRAGADFASEPGPAMLIDGDCSICKPSADLALNFAPLFPLAVIHPSTQGNIRRGRVMRHVYLPAHRELEGEEYYVDLQAIFSLPRREFAVTLVRLNDDPRESRWQVDEDPPLGSKRALSLDDGGRRALKNHLAWFFELRDDQDQHAAP